jgi:Do/DeqQ family serine protease
MENRRTAVGPLVSGILIGVAMCAAFWAGHTFWTEPAVSTTAVITSPVSKPDAQLKIPTNVLVLAENTIADIAKQAGDSVVNIDISSSVTMADFPFQSPFSFRDFDFFFGPGFGNGQSPRGQHKFERRGSGSGLIFRSDGYILTNNHVVGQADDIQVTLNDKRVFKGTVVGRDSFTDLALVKIDAKDLPAAQLGTSKNIRPGDWAIAIGSPLGLDHSVTLGIISALGRSLSDLNNNVELIQTDAAINPGNSGGPLLNIHGQVIGVNTAIRGDAQNIGFAIPIDVAKEVASLLLTRGSIERPYLGIYMQELDEKLARSMGLSTTTKGVVIAGLAPNSPAEKSGLMQGDVIQKVEGKTVTTGKEIQALVRAHKPGESLSFLILREKTIKPLPVRIGTYPKRELNQQ